MQSYHHLLSPAIHSSVASTREKHLQAAAKLDSEAEILEFKGTAKLRAKDANIAAEGREEIRQAQTLRSRLALHLARATDLTDYDDDAGIDQDWLARAMTSAAPCLRSHYEPTTAGGWASAHKVAA
ncbi:MAG: hypothetical protein V4662_13750 [Verrucomicrobiota bacterium]